LTLTEAELEQAKKIDALSFEAVEAPSGDEKAELLAKLKALGIDAAGNSKVETLRKKLEEAEAAAAAEKQKVMDELKSLNLEFDAEANVEALQAALAAAKA
jgi:ribosomal protein L9